MDTFTPERLEHISQVVLEAMGTPADLATIVGKALVGANLVGHDSHGVLRLPQYYGMVQHGQIHPAERASIVKQEGTGNAATAQVDGGWGWGQPAAQLATRTAIDLAKANGVGAVTINRCNHVGRLGEYVEMIARAGCIGIAFSNINPAVAAFGGRARLFGTNPIAFATPRGDGQDPVLVDYATAATAEGKLQVAKAKGEQIGPGLILDKNGYPSQDPMAFYDDGVLLPFGGHKGYGLSVMVELLGGALSGMAPSSLPEYGGGNGTLLIALNVPAFVPLEQFTRQADGLAANIKATPKAPGVKEVMVPGEPEWTTQKQRRRDGVALPPATWDAIQKLAETLKVALPDN